MYPLPRQRRSVRWSLLLVVRLKRLVVGATALAVGSAVAAAGIIGFIGLVVPHLIRLTFDSMIPIVAAKRLRL